MIIKCKCQHEAQDKIHGEGMRAEDEIIDRIAMEYDSMHIALFPKERQEHEDNIAKLEKELTLAVWPYPMCDGEE